MDKKPWYTPDEVSLICGQCTETIRRWCRKGKLKYYRSGDTGNIRIPYSEVEALMLEIEYFNAQSR